MLSSFLFLLMVITNDVKQIDPEIKYFQDNSFYWTEKNGWGRLEYVLIMYTNGNREYIPIWIRPDKYRRSWYTPP